MRNGAETTGQDQWDKRPYRRIDRARCDWDGTLLTVDFENGDQVQIDPMSILPRVIQHDEIDWWRVGSNRSEVLFPMGETWLVVPWDVVRLETDPAFRAHRTRNEDQISKSRGERIRELREALSLSALELAERAKVTADDVNRVESGTHDSGFDPTSMITALGRTWANLYDVIAVGESVSQAS